MGCLTYGSGFFVEDGTEQRNLFEHNLAVYCMPAAQNEYFNPSPIYGNVSSDHCQLGVFWLKNSQNAMLRNVACCCPGNTAAFWYVPQPIARLWGPSAPLIGSSALKLPAVGSLGAVTGGCAFCGLSQQGNNALAGIAAGDGGMDCYSEGASVACSCWKPPAAEFDYVLTDPRTGCNSYSTTNVTAPVYVNAENVCYAMSVFHSEFPEEINMGQQWAADPPGSNATAAQNCGWGFQDNEAAPIFLATDGQNACTDAIVGVYPPTQWALPFKATPTADTYSAYIPLSEDEHQAADADCNTSTQNLMSAAFPKIFSGALTFNLGTSSGLWGGAGWVKQVPPFLLNCCFLEVSPRVSGGESLAMGLTNGPQGALFASSCNAGDAIYCSIYPVYYIFMTNGAVGVMPKPTVFAGDKTFFNDKTVLAYATEVAASAAACLHVYAFFDAESVSTSVGCLRLSKRSAMPRLAKRRGHSSRRSRRLAGLGRPSSTPSFAEASLTRGVCSRRPARARRRGLYDPNGKGSPPMRSARISRPPPLSAPGTMSARPSPAFTRTSPPETPSGTAKLQKAPNSGLVRACGVASTVRRSLNSKF